MIWTGHHITEFGDRGDLVYFIALALIFDIVFAYISNPLNHTWYTKRLIAVVKVPFVIALVAIAINSPNAKIGDTDLLWGIVISYTLYGIIVCWICIRVLVVVSREPPSLEESLIQSDIIFETSSITSSDSDTSGISATTV
tara:strand:+ start:381 stop:803 length:423 start_codon:yes stop_codon:yes gene_type:complete